MGKMERMVVLVTPGQKRAIVSHAKARRLTMGEMVRRSVAAYQDEEEAVFLEKMVDRVKVSSLEATQALAAAESEVRKTLAHFAARRREAARP